MMPKNLDDNPFYGTQEMFSARATFWQQWALTG